MSGPARSVALLGGGFSTDEDGLLDDWLLGRARGSRPKVCFVPTASGDAPAYVDQFLNAFESRDCEPSVLPLFRRQLDDKALRTFPLSQDVVYVGGGNTANLLAVWRAHGVDQVLSEPGRRTSYRASVATGMLSPGWAAEDGVGGPLRGRSPRGSSRPEAGSTPVLGAGR